MTRVGELTRDVFRIELASVNHAHDSSKRNAVAFTRTRSVRHRPQSYVLQEPTQPEVATISRRDGIASSANANSTRRAHVLAASNVSSQHAHLPRGPGTHGRESRKRSKSSAVATSRKLTRFVQSAFATTYLKLSGGCCSQIGRTLQGLADPSPSRHLQPRRYSREAITSKSRLARTERKRSAGGSGGTEPPKHLEKNDPRDRARALI